MPPKHKHKLGAALSLSKFSTAKKTTYDKRAKQEKERALNAAKVNAYKKLKKRLGDKLEPKIKLTEDVSDDEQQTQQQLQQGGQAAVPPPRQQEREEEERQQYPGSGPDQQHHQQQQHGALHPTGKPHKQHRLQGQQQQQQHSAKGRDGGGGGKWHKPAPHLQRIAEEVQANKEAEAREREERQRAAEERRAKLAADAKQRAAKSKAFRKKTSQGQPVMKYRVEKMLQQLQQG